MTPLAPGEQLLLVVPGPQYLISLLYTSMPPMRPPSLTLSPSFPFPHLLIFTGSTGPGRTQRIFERRRRRRRSGPHIHLSKRMSVRIVESLVLPTARRCSKEIARWRSRGLDVASACVDTA